MPNRVRTEIKSLLITDCMSYLKIDGWGLARAVLRHDSTFMGEYFSPEILPRLHSLCERSSSLM